MRKWLLILLALIAASSYADIYKVDINRGKVNLVPFLEYNIGQSDPLEAPPIEGWSQFNKDYIKLGYDNRVHWFRFELENKNPSPLSLYIELANPLMDNVTFYTLYEGKVRNVQNLGDNYPFQLRPVAQESFVVPVAMLAMESIEVYIAVQSEGAVNFPLTLWQKETFQQHENYRRLISGMFIGLILAAIFAYSVLFIFSHSKNALLDALLMFSLLMITLTMNGYAFHYIWPDFPAMQQHAIYLFSCLAMASSALLAKNYVKVVQPKHPLIHSFNAISVGILLLMPMTLYLNYEWALYLVTSAVIVLCSFHIYSGYWLWKQGIEEDQDLNLGVAVLLCAVLFIAMNSFTESQLPFNNLDLLQLAMLVIATILSVSMIKKQIEKQHQTTLQINDEEVELADDLQKRLAEQNLELQLTLRELEERNSELEKINTLDALTGIHNRRHFDKRLQAEVRRSKRELTPLSLIMFDIDHFKKVNDKFGHVAGDEVIRVVAHSAEDEINRSSDEVFRYGGEEFALLLANTDLTGAELLAEKIRQTIEQKQINTSSGIVNCTVSFGVASTTEEHPLSPEKLLEHADKALYNAKEQGRNRVVIYKQEE